MLEFWNFTAHPLIKEKTDELLENALNAACLSIQNDIGQTDGGWAGIHFSDDDNVDLFNSSLEAYIHQELFTMYNAFVESKEESSDLGQDVGFEDWDAVQSGLIYVDRLYIEEVNEAIGKYMLVLGNWYDACSDDLTELEMHLFVWAIGEGYFKTK